MANKHLFQSASCAQRHSAAHAAPITTSINHAYAPAYELDARTALAQLAATGCFGNTFYVSGVEQLDRVLDSASRCDATYVAKVAIYARERGYMKDMPALLLAHLTTRGPSGLALASQVFARVIDNGRMLRNFVQVLRSGRVGRKSLGTAPKKMVQRWLRARAPMQLFRDSIGNDPSLSDVVRMVHPTPVDEAQRAMFGYLLGKPHDAAQLPLAVRAYEAWKRGERDVAVPDVPSRMLDGLPLGSREWKAIATSARWQETRMSLNTYARHHVFDDPEMVELIARRLEDEREVRGAKAFPYQLLAAFIATDRVPARIRAALGAAMEQAVANVPAIEGDIVVCPDVSGSMSGAITGDRGSGTSRVRCIDVAGLVTAALLRKNPRARVIPFETQVVSIALDPQAPITTLAAELAKVGGGGTNCSAPLQVLVRERAKVDAVIYVSDNESWVDARNGYGSGTAMMEQWMELRRRNPSARLVCIDLTPNVHKQVIERDDILHVGGFSDAVFEIVGQFLRARGDARDWAAVIDAIDL